MDPPPSNPPVRSLEFYYPDGNVVFQVSGVLYRLHKSVLTARLDLFGGMFILSDGSEQPGGHHDHGQDDEHAVQIADGVAVREDFEALIKHIYGQWTAPPYPVPFLLSILKLSTRWGSEDGRERAIYHLGDPNTNFSNLLKFHASIKYNVPQWTRPAFDVLVSTDWKLGDLPTLAGYDLSLELIDLVIKTRDIVFREQRRLATLPPPVSHHQNCGEGKRSKCNEAWKAAWILAIGRQIIHVDPLFQLKHYQATEVIRGLVVPGMSEHCLDLTVERLAEFDAEAFDYIHKVCTAALARLGL